MPNPLKSKICGSVKSASRFIFHSHSQFHCSNSFSSRVQTMFNFVAAISNASTSAVNLAYAFFDPSGLSWLINGSALIFLKSLLRKTYLISVLIFTQSTSYNFFNASLICLLFALTSQMNTSVLFSSIFFIALSVLRGLIITLW